MSVHPLPDPAEERDNATFEALLWALARPGEVRRLPEAGPAAVALALVDRECVVHADDPDLLRVLADTGARRGPAEVADHAFLLHPEGMLADLARLPAGTALHPDDGATLVVRASIGAGDEVVLAGPGVESLARLRVGGLPEGFWAARAARCRYPEGIDLFLLDGDRVVGIPRSARVEAP